MEALAVEQVARERVLGRDGDRLELEIEVAWVDAPRAIAQERAERAGRSVRSSTSASAASAPIVSTPAPRSRASARGPTPGRRRTASGARNAASVPGGTTVMPPGLRRSEAILQTTFDVPTPSEQVRLVPPRTAVWTADAIARRE